MQWTHIHIETQNVTLCVVNKWEATYFRSFSKLSAFYRWAGNFSTICFFFDKTKWIWNFSTKNDNSTTETSIAKWTELNRFKSHRPQMLRTPFNHIRLTITILSVNFIFVASFVEIHAKQNTVEIERRTETI